VKISTRLFWALVVALARVVYSLATSPSRGTLNTQCLAGDTISCYAYYNPIAGFVGTILGGLFIAALVFFLLGLKNRSAKVQPKTLPVAPWTNAKDPCPTHGCRYCPECCGKVKRGPVNVTGLFLDVDYEQYNRERDAEYLQGAK
jgi:hypothetical protein